MKKLIGRKVKGFKFSNVKHNEIGYFRSMDECVGCEGEIIKYFDTYNSYLVKFGDNPNTWCYPAELIEQHLID